MITLSSRKEIHLEGKSWPHIRDSLREKGEEEEEEEEEEQERRRKKEEGLHCTILLVLHLCPITVICVTPTTSTYS